MSASENVGNGWIVSMMSSTVRPTFTASVASGSISAARGPTLWTPPIPKRLDEFEDAGLVSRTQYDEIPPRVEYALTDDGDEVRKRLEPLLEWAEQQS